MKQTNERPIATTAPALQAAQFPQGEMTINLSWVKTGAFRKHRLQTELSGIQGRALRAVFDSMQFSGARMLSGREVRTQDDAVKHILETIASKIGIE